MTSKAPFQKLAHYVPAYNAEFSGIPVKRLLEIGVANGGSLRWWKRKFPEAQIFGVDISEKCKKHAEERIEVIICDQSNKGEMAKIGKQHGPFDVIIDDGGHKRYQQKASFEALWPYLSKPGCYCVEDLHANYWFGWNPFSAAYGGFVRDAAKLAHVLNSGWIGPKHPVRWLVGRTPVVVDDLVKISFYDSMVFIHKGEHPETVMVSEET